MWISFKEYERLIACEQMKHELEAEVKRLAELISAEVKDCKVGPWCKGCLHIGKDAAIVKSSFGTTTYISEIGGDVQYCKKHLHEICSEFERG